MGLEKLHFWVIIVVNKGFMIFMSNDEQKPDENESEEEITADTDDDFEFDTTDGNLADKLKKLRAELKATQKEKTEYLSGWQRSKADYLNLKR